MSLIERLKSRFAAAVPAVDVEPVTFPAYPPAYPADVFTVPVVLVSYFPVANGRISRAVTGDIDAPLEAIRRHTAQATDAAVRALELGSMYHGYKDAAAAPSLRYAILDRVEFLEPLPTWRKPGHAAPMTDYRAIMERIGIERRVEERGVKEVWIWGYHGGVVDLWESNMSGPFGDISNSDRDPGDLPVFGHTYTVYHYNYGRGASEAIEDHMHQVEAVLRHADPELFWERFVGKPGEGRCGWAHFPPNGTRDYDWANRRPIATDIEDWRPEGGRRTSLDSRRWRSDSLTWFTYWMENLPGRDTGLAYRGRPLTNWWQFIGDWDGAMARGEGLVAR
ncbi:MAG: hypothetical protein HYX53_15710 [Chloroflexi bacterium]|nr:hypothetical protein [Chloroflexota bacterium]